MPLALICLTSSQRLAAGLGVEAGGGFVEEEDFGVVDEADGDGEALLLSAGGVSLALAWAFFSELEPLRGVGGH